MNRAQMGIALAACAFAAALPSGAAAADTTAPAPGSSTGLSELLASSGLTVSGYVAASYYHSSGYNSFHEFDVRHDTFQLDQAGLQIGYQPKEGFGAFADLIAGEDAR